MSDTCGPSSTNSSASATLSRSWASKLKAKTDVLGSAMYTFKWKESVTPSGIVLPLLRASGLRTHATDCTGRRSAWATPSATTWGGTVGQHLARKEKARAEGKSMGLVVSNLDCQAQLAAYPTPQAGSPPTETNNGAGNTDYSRKVVELFKPYPTPDTNQRGGAQHPEKRQAGGHAVTLQDAALLFTAPRVTPAARDHKEGNCKEQVESGAVPVNSLLERQVLLTDSGRIVCGCPVRTASGGRLNPALSRFLMGLPVIWDVCALRIPSRSSSRSSKKRRTVQHASEGTATA